MMKVSTIGRAALGMVGALLAAPASAEGCGGNLIEYVPVVVDGEKIGQLQLYYNPGNGKNCAIMLHGGPTWGVPIDTGVLLAKAPRRNGSYSQAGYQREVFRHQAGPVRTDGRGQCVYAGGGIDWKGQRRSVFTGQHCR